jgi:WD40 repeat protein
LILLSEEAMIDGDEIITIASETGYRLCLREKNAEAPPSSNFSVCWCPNNPKCYYACTMDGYVNCTDTSKNSETGFEILFRKFSGTAEKIIDPGRRISLHWDKMCLIPKRPGDVLFLLGVAKCLFYSAFPGSLSPMSASVHSCCPGFTYGTPVMELLTHTSRITAVSVSPCGHIVATGDENGYIKMIILNRPDRLKHTINKRHTEEINFAFEEEVLNGTGIRCHTGPIFSLEWMSPMSDEPYNPKSENLSFGLATGSSDRCVRM